MGPLIILQSLKPDLQFWELLLYIIAVCFGATVTLGPLGASEQEKDVFFF